MSRRVRAYLNAVYFGSGSRGRTARWVLLALDVLVVGFFMVTTFTGVGGALLYVEYALGLLLLADFAGRCFASDDRLGFVLSPLVLVDLAIILSLFAPALTENLAFLRVLRALRLVRSYSVLRELRSSFGFFRRNEEVIFSALNLVVFVFVVSAVVYVLQVRTNAAIGNYMDALYFTVTTLTTTGFGDITLTGPTGRLLAVMIMIIGVSLFLRLIQTIFRPRKVRYECPDCGLSRHEPDAIHCKHCGRVLHIRNPADD